MNKYLVVSAIKCSTLNSSIPVAVVKKSDSSISGIRRIDNYNFQDDGNKV